MCVCGCCAVMAEGVVEALRENRMADRICVFECRNCDDTSTLVVVAMQRKLVFGRVVDWCRHFVRDCDFRCGGLMNDGDCCLDGRRCVGFRHERVVDFANDAFR